MIKTRFCLCLLATVALLIAVASQPAMAVVTLYSQDFESLNNGDSASLLPGWGSTVNPAPDYLIASPGELSTGKAMDNRDSAELRDIQVDLTDAAVLSVPSVGSGLWTVSMDTYVFGGTGFSYAMDVSGNTGAGDIRWGSAEWNNSGSWFVRLWDTDAVTQVSELVASPGGDTDHLLTLAFVVDEANNQIWMDIGGTESTKLAFLTADLPEITTVVWVDLTTSSGLTDNVLITATNIPEPSTLVLLGLGLVVLSGYGCRKAKLIV